MSREEDHVDDERRELLEHYEIQNKTSRSEHKEGWLGWLVVACSFTCICVLDGIGYSFGVFLEPLLVEFNEGRGALSIADIRNAALDGEIPTAMAACRRWV